MKTTLVNALGQAGYSQAESVLLELLNNNPSGDLEKVLYEALGRIGTKASLEPLKRAGKQNQYTYGKANPTAAYLFLLNRLAVSEPHLVKKEAEKFLSEATKLGRQNLKVAAAELLLALPSTDKNGLLKKALKDGNIVYLTQVLNSYPFQDDEKAVKLILKTLSPKSLFRCTNSHSLLDWKSKSDFCGFPYFRLFECIEQRRAKSGCLCLVEDGWRACCTSFVSRDVEKHR